MTPQFRFTMFHDTVSPSGTVVVQPIGWKDASVSLTRDPRFHSLVEYFKGSFIWYGNARQFIRDVEDIGPEEKLRILIEIYYSAWETLFDGVIDIIQLEDLSKKETFYKLTAPIIRNDFWAKFINRLTTPIDLQATVDLDGNARTAVNKITLPLPSQVVFQEYYSRTFNYDDPARHEGTLLYEFTALYVGNVSLPIVTKNTLKNVRERYSKDTFQLFSSEIKDELAVFIANDDGDIEIDFSIVLADNPFGVPYGGSTKPTATSVVKLKVNGALQSVTRTDYGTAGVDERSVYTYSGSHTIKKGQYVELYLASTVTEDIYICHSGLYEDTYISITSATTYKDTTCDAYLLKDAAESILSKTTGNDGVLVSTILDTCQGLNAISKIKNIRGYLFAEKAITMSFDEWWKGAEPILNLGLGYTENADEIEIEVKDEFYDPTPVVFIPNVSNLVRKYDTGKYVKNIDVGYNSWSSESDSGIDDPQSRRRYRTKFATIGEDLTIYSLFYASSLGIEQARRNTKELSKDYKNDEDIAIINIKSDGGSGYEPVLGTDFNAVTNLLYSDTRYNIRHACARIFKRWQKFLQGCLAHTTGEYFYFAGGEGNYEMTSQFETTDCEATDDPEPVLAEDQDIAVDETNFDFIPKLYTAKVPMSKSTYDTILANRKKALGISQTTTNYLPMHIMDLDYKIFGGYAELQLLLASNTPVNPDGDFILQEDGNMILMEDGTSGILIE